jgi:anti-sigma factor RsiW
MSENCYDIGTIQAFLDGEVSPEIAMRLTDHAAECDVCALALADAEEENSLVFATLEREMNTLVPTQRLWSRINESIEVEKSRMSVWQRLAAFISTSLISPSFATAAGVLLIAVMFAMVWNYRSTPVADQPGTTVARNDATAPAVSQPPKPVYIALTGRDSVPSPSTSDRSAVQYVGTSNLPADKIRKMVTNANYTPANAPITAQHAVVRESTNSVGYLPGEESYVKTIADLKQNVDTKKDTVLSPSSRVSYERDMAVVDDSIKKMRAAVKNNPKNQAAKQVLYSSYQDKIDLLNSVAQREELMASIR